MNQAEYKIRNLESQILYLQQEHASTLKLLHDEIKDLQMKNSETSLQLAMLNINSNDCDIEKSQSDNIDLLENISQLKDEIEELNTQLNKKVAQLEEYHVKFNHLSGSITDLKDRHKTEIAALETELSNKSSDIVNLSAKLLKSLDQSKTVIQSPGDCELISQKSSYISQSPITPKTFKFRNQISVHPDNIHLRRRPIIARQTMVSTSVPIKSTVPQSLYPEYAVSVEDRAVFSKSIRRPSILPPIQSSRNRNNNDGRSSSVSVTPRDLDSEVHQRRYHDRSNSQQIPDANVSNVNTNFSHLSSDSKLVHVEVDRLLDITHSSSIRPSTQTVNWNITKKNSSL